jgi:hypothetical protein
VLLTRQEAQALRHAIAQSPGSQPQVTIPRLVEGLSRKQVSQILGKSEGACQVIPHRGMMAHRNRLADPKNRRPKAQTTYGVEVWKSCGGRPVRRRPAITTQERDGLSSVPLFPRRFALSVRA